MSANEEEVFLDEHERKTAVEKKSLIPQQSKIWRSDLPREPDTSEYLKEYPCVFTEYQPEMRAVEKTVIYNAIEALKAGLEYAEEALILHDQQLGRTTRKNTELAKIIEREVAMIKKSIEELKK